MCVYVCMCVCMYVCMYSHTHYVKSDLCRTKYCLNTTMFNLNLSSPAGCVLKLKTVSVGPGLLNAIWSLTKNPLLGPVIRTHNRQARAVNYLLTPWCRVLLQKLAGLQLVKKFPAFYGTRRFITALTSVRHLSLSCASPIQSTYSHPNSWRSILILSTHLRLGLPSGLFPSGFPTKILYAPLSSPICATCPAHLILLDFITRTILGEEYRSFSSSLCNLLH